MDFGLGRRGSSCKYKYIYCIYKIYTIKGGNVGQKILLNLPEKDLKKIETVVKAGEYTTKSEFIRFAVKQLLYNQERIKTFEELTAKLQRQIKAGKIARKDTEKEIEEAKEETRKIISRMKK